MITMSELLADPFYNRFIRTKPEMPPVTTDKRAMRSPPWVVYVQRERDGRWGKKEFWKYNKALKFMLLWVEERGAYNAALNCRRVSFNPPSRLVRIKGKFVTGSDGVNRPATKRVKWEPPAKLLIDQPQHHWCCYCRRPTVFKYLKRHKALPGIEVDQSTPRCSICGASARIAIPHGDRKFRAF